MTSPAAPALEIRGLTVRYREVVALREVDLVVPQGVACGLVGMNGSGKSTLMRSVIGLERPVAGEVRLFGGGVDAARRAGSVGYVPQQDDVDRDFPVTVREAVLTGRYHRTGSIRRHTAADHEVVDRALAEVGLADLASRRLGRLSGGQRQRVLLARALAQEARLLLLDEPFTGLDTASQAAVLRVLESLVSRGVSVLVSTHDLTVLPDLCTTSVLLQGEVLAAGPAEQVLTPENLALTFGLGRTPR